MKQISCKSITRGLGILLLLFASLNCRKEVQKPETRPSEQLDLPSDNLNVSATILSQTRTATLFNNLSEPYLDLWSQAGPQYFSADDGSFAYSKRLAGNRWSLLLVLKGFGFTIPSGATIENITVTAKRFKKGRGNVKDYFATLLRPLAFPGDLFEYGVRFTNQDNYTDVESTVSYTQNGSGVNGDVTHDQPYQWTPEMINDPKFGVRIDNSQPTGGSVVIYYDLVEITVQYSLP